MKIKRHHPLWVFADTNFKYPITDFKYIETYAKGKKPKFPEDYRFLIESTNTKKTSRWLIWFEDYGFHTTIETLEIGKDVKIISSAQLKNSGYNYYLYDTNKQNVKDMIDKVNKNTDIKWSYISVHL